MVPPRLEVIVARYRERVDWTRNLPAGVKVTIYDKGGDLAYPAFPHASIERLENVGSEAETYLHHFVTRYRELAGLTVCVQGHPFDHAHDLHRVVRALAQGEEGRVTGFRWLGFIVDTDDPRGRRLFVPWSKNRDRRELAVDVFHEELFGEPAPAALRFFPGGQFVVAAKTVRSRPPEFWEKARGLARSFPDAAHCYERLWDKVFGVVGVDPAWLGGEPTRYLKPIRKLAGRGPGGRPP